MADDDTAGLVYVEALTVNEGGGDVEFVIGLRTIPTADVRAYLTLDQSTYLTFKNVQTDGGDRYGPQHVSTTGLQHGSHL